MHYHNVLAFFVEKCKVFDLYPPAAYLFSSLWIANINYFNYIQLFCTSQNEEVIRQWYFFVKHFRKETSANDEMVLHIQTESKKLREIEEQLERENQDLKSEKLTWEVEKKNLEERYMTFCYIHVLLMIVLF